MASKVSARRKTLVPVIGSVLLLLLVVSLAVLATSDKEGGFFDRFADWFGPSTDVAEERDHEGATDADVAKAVRDLLAEINILRAELGVTDYPPEAELLEDRSPIHVYAKTLEVLSKVVRTQRRFGVPEAENRQIPFKDINAGDVLGSVEYVIAEIRKIKAQMVIESEIEAETATPAGNLSPSFIYKSLADASFLLDGLGGKPLTPDDVYRNCTHLLDEMAIIANELGVVLDPEAIEVDEDKRSKEVAQQVLRATYKVINLQTRLGMDASGVPSLTLVRVTPSEVYDSTNMLLAEMARIKFHLGIDEQRAERPEETGKRPRDSFALILGVIKSLDSLAASVED